MESPNWTEINAGIQQHLQKPYNTNTAAFKAQHWDIDPTIGPYNVEKIRRARPKNITASEWDKYIEFWNDPRNIARAVQNRQNRAKSTVNDDDDADDEVDLRSGPAVRGKLLRALTMALTFFESTSGLTLKRTMCSMNC
nr:hypothetical protein [Tanacetum cinerariifolium]